MASIINWFEIPSVDFERAVRFYSAVLNRTFEVIEGPSNGRMAPFGPLDAEVNGAIVHTDLYTAGPNGPALYLTVDGKLDDYLARVEPAGGQVINPKTPIGDGTGYWARIADSEGNHVGLYSRT